MANSDSALWTSSSSYYSTPTGSGTSSSPYKIANAEQLAYLAAKKYYGSVYAELTADIDLSAHKWKPIGKQDMSSSTQCAMVLNGNNHKISGLYCDDNNGEFQYLGLFSLTTNRTTSQYFRVSNLVIDSPVIYSTNSNSSTRCGCVIGYAYFYNNAPTFSNVTVLNPTITILKGNAGGICGYTEGANISGCNVIGLTMKVESSNTSDSFSLGGLCGSYSFHQTTAAQAIANNNVIITRIGKWEGSDNTNSSTRIGGLFGSLSASASKYVTSLSNNTVTIEKLENYYSKSYCGGFAGTCSVACLDMLLKTNYINKLIFRSTSSSYTEKCGLFIGHDSESTTDTFTPSVLPRRCLINITKISNITKLGIEKYMSSPLTVEDLWDWSDTEKSLNLLYVFDSSGNKLPNIYSALSVYAGKKMTYDQTNDRVVCLNNYMTQTTSLKKMRVLWINNAEFVVRNMPSFYRFDGEDMSTTGILAYEGDTLTIPPPLYSSFGTSISWSTLRTSTSNFDDVTDEQVSIIYGDKTTYFVETSQITNIGDKIINITNDYALKDPVVTTSGHDAPTYCKDSSTSVKADSIYYKNASGNIVSVSDYMYKNASGNLV